MKTLHTIIFAAAFFVPGLLVIYGLIFSIVFLFLAISSGDYHRFISLFLCSIGGGVGFFASAQLLNRYLDNSANTIRPLWLKFFLLAGFLALILPVTRLSASNNIVITILIFLPTPIVFYLMYQNRQYLWGKS